jgi:hypothetical protein
VFISLIESDSSEEKKNHGNYGSGFRGERFDIVEEFV